MREIVFRGKREDTGEWVYGGFTLDAIDEPRITQKDYSGKGLTFYHVNSYTVGQYTGMCDCNGTKVFEGDIVRILPKHINTTASVVHFSNGSFYIGDITVSSLLPKDMKITGNIHNTTELIGERRMIDIEAAKKKLIEAIRFLPENPTLAHLRMKEALAELHNHQSYWWCHKCKDIVDGFNITHQGVHVACGHKAKYIMGEE